MNLLGREFIGGSRSEAFLQGVASVLPKKEFEKVQLLRISVKPRNGVIDVIYSIWGRPDKPPMGVFTIGATSPFPRSVANFKYEDWLHAGEIVGKDMKDWVQNDAEFETQVRKAQAKQFDVWETSPEWDVAQDLIEALEQEYGPHLHGKIHPVPRKGLSNSIVSLIKEVRQDSLVRANTPKIPSRGKPKVSALAKS